VPFNSKAQRRKFAQLLVEGKIKPETYEEWNRETGRASCRSACSPSSARRRARDGLRRAREGRSSRLTLDRVAREWQSQRVSGNVRLWAVVVALALGVAQGWLCQQLPLRPVVKDLAAAIVGWMAGGISALLMSILLTVRTDTAGLGSVSFGLTEAFIFGVPAMILLALLGRVGLRHVGSSSLATQPPILLGAVAAVMGALSATAGVVTGN